MQVTCLNRENATEDAVLYHFENPKNGGGEVIKVELNIKEGCALVHFVDPEGIKISYLRRAKIIELNHVYI